jgi:hypothetical protein
MTDEELETLLTEMSEQISQLSAKTEKTLSRQERKKKAILQLKCEALDKLKKAREKHNLNQEVRASMDYALLCEYGEKHPLWMNYMKSQMGLWGF